MILTTADDKMSSASSDDFSTSEEEANMEGIESDSGSEKEDIDNSESDNEEKSGEIDGESDVGSEEENDEDSAASDDSDSKDNKINFNPGWADAMAKILKLTRPKGKKTIVLSKAKKRKLGSEDKVDPLTFQVEGEESEKKISAEDDTSAETKEKIRLQIERRIQRKFSEAKGRVKASVLDKEREKVLSKVATKGVVQLFNAVRQQQKHLDKEMEKAGPSEVKKERVLKSVDKRAFLDVLMGAKSQTVPEIKEEEPNNEWSVLRNDFMMGAKLKDWDKDEEPSKTDCM